MSLPARYKEEFTKIYPKHMHEVYEHARTIDMSLDWGKEDSQKTPHNGKEQSKPSTSKPYQYQEKREALSDNSLISWGKARRGEGDMYRSNDRCMTCAKKGWSDKTHPCRKEREEAAKVPQAQKTSNAA